VAVEYELEASHLTLRNVVISIPIPANSLPSVTGDADWRAERNAFIWTIDTVDAENSSGSLEFRCDGDADAFFPVNVGFVAAGSLANVDVSHTLQIDNDPALTLCSRSPRQRWLRAERNLSRKRRYLRWTGTRSFDDFSCWDRRKTKRCIVPSGSSFNIDMQACK
jgi:hypothetical protein